MSSTTRFYGGPTAKNALLQAAGIYDVSRIYQGAKITVIRPSIIKIPWLDYVSLIFAQRKEIHQQIKEFSPDVIIGLGILSSYAAMKAAKRNDIPFIYYWIDLLHRLIPFNLFSLLPGYWKVIP